MPGKRKPAEQDFNKQENEARKKRKEKIESAESPVADVVSPSSLTSKSVLSLFGDKEDSCLLFLEKGQVVCIKGKVQIQTVVGVTEVFGYKLRPCHGAVNIFSASNSSLLTVTEDSENNIVKKTELKSVLKKALHNQSGEVIKKAVARAKMASSVVLMISLPSVEVDFVFSVQHFQDFNFDIDKDISCTETEILLKKKTAALGFLLLEPDVKRFGVLNVPEEWDAVFHSVMQAQQTTVEKAVKAPVVLVCGGKDVGKSTLARFLINSLLNRSKEVCFLECDVGQTEFTPPGIISLNRVCFPLLGPPFTHLRQPERAVFFGDVSPKDKPEFYIKCINDVYKSYADIFQSKVPLVINTQGWVKGMGVPLLLDVIRMTEPSHIIQFNSSSQPNKNLPMLTCAFLAETSGWAFPLLEDHDFSKERNSFQSRDGVVLLDPPCQADPGDKSRPFDPVVLQLESFESRGDSPVCKLGAPEYRTLALLAYFSSLEKQSLSGFSSLLAHTPYRVHWNQVTVHVMHTQVPWNQVLYSLNASVVGLVHISANQMSTPKETSDTPHILQETPVATCLGLGIVRNIDPVEKLFYILTPVPLQVLQQVNTLLKGNLEIPAAFLQKTEIPNTPYVSSEFSYDLRGAGARKVRYNLLRRKPLHAPGTSVSPGVCGHFQQLL